MLAKVYSLALQPLDGRREESVFQLVHLAPLLVLNWAYVTVNVSLCWIEFMFGVFDVRFQVANWA